MSKKIRNFASKSQPMTEKQANRIRKDTKRLAEHRGLPKAEADRLVRLALDNQSRHQASNVIRSLIGLLPEASPSAKKVKAVPKGQMVNEVLAKAKTAGLTAAKVAPLVRMLNDEPLKGSAVIRFKGNNAVGKAWKSLTGEYEWNVPSTSGSFDKLEAFVNAFTSVVKDSGFDLEGKVDAVIS